MSVAKLPADITRTDRQMADGRTIRYYDSNGQSRTAQDKRPAEAHFVRSAPPVKIQANC